MGRNTKYSATEFEPFVLDDGTGTAYIEPSDADVVLTSGDEFEVEGGDHPPAFIGEFLDRETSVQPVASRKRWYREYRIDADGAVRVAGHAGVDAASAPDEAVTTAVVDAGDAPKFVVTDDPDLGLGKRMRQEALGNFLVGGILLVFAYFLLFL
ncbi:hypothetical protein [Haloarcula pelagica]|uniref:hypothetical protein n=1 Tax=Haloarcula pelagica TaxID=3033389 RepID=UPI0024C350B0|nr:hypothetical protein [Halomicroarcula sp. YJ-61-S]